MINAWSICYLLGNRSFTKHIRRATSGMLYLVISDCETLSDCFTYNRHNLGLSPDIWQGFTDVLTKAIPVLESQSFAWKSPPSANYEHSSSNLIAYNYFSLVKDIERLNDLCTIARNLLATTKKAQNIAAEKGFDQRILALVDTCVRVTARGFDGETNARNEERWQKV